MKLKYFFCNFLIVLGCLLLFPSVGSSSSNNANIYCKALDRTGMLDRPCKVSVANKSINLFIMTSEKEAKKMCYGMLEEAPYVGLYFGSEWSIRIFSPIDGSVLAKCYF